MAWAKVLGGIVCGLTLWAAASANAAAPSWANVTETLTAEYPQAGPGAVAIAARDGEVVYEHASGQASLELHVALTPSSVVRIASLTKQFTAVAVLQLVEAGRLALDDTLEQRLADCPPAWRRITVRQLLSHTSGLTGDMSPIFADPARDRTPDELLAPYRALPLAAAPGAQWRYSNLNYWILGRLIETVSGQSYAAYIAGRVLAPGMTDTRYGDPLVIVPGRAAGYEDDGKTGWRNARHFSQTLGYAAGSFISTPEDMVRWYAALGRGRILSRAMLALAGTEVRTTDGKPTGYGLGWYVSDIEGEHVLHHGGSSIGFEAYVFWSPARGAFSGVFKNSSDPRGEPREDARMLLEALKRSKPDD